MKNIIIKRVPQKDNILYYSSYSSNQNKYFSDTAVCKSVKKPKRIYTWNTYVNLVCVCVCVCVCVLSWFCFYAVVSDLKS